MFCNDPGIVQYNMNLCTGLKDYTPGAKLHPSLVPRPPPSFLSLAVSTASDGMLGGAWERGYVTPPSCGLFIHVYIITVASGTS